MSLRLYRFKLAMESGIVSLTNYHTLVIQFGFSRRTIKSNAGGQKQ